MLVIAVNLSVHEGVFGWWTTSKINHREALIQLLSQGIKKCPRKIKSSWTFGYSRGHIDKDRYKQAIKREAINLPVKKK